LPWEPDDSDWWNPDNDNIDASQMLMYLIIGIVLAIFAIIAVFMPIPGGVLGRIIVFIIGLIIAFIIYIYPF